MSGKLILWAEDIRKYIQSGLYRQFDAAGRLLYIGETDNFSARSVDACFILKDAAGPDGNPGLTSETTSNGPWHKGFSINRR
jgi:hypothetical protein